MKTIWVALMLALVSVTAVANPPLVFDNPEQEARFKKMMTELRCLVCQNQSLEDSHAPLAQDLRNQAYAMVRDGATDEDIMHYMVDRYGDFVRYRPALKPLTFLLWFGPLLLLALAATVAWRWFHGQRVIDHEPLSANDQARAKRLLSGKAALEGRKLK